jgi:HEAT repeat protein
MKKRRSILITLLVLFSVGVAFLVPHVNVVVTGWWLGEPFYERMPASYWSAAFKKDPYAGERFRHGGAAAIPVLWMLLKDEDPRVSRQATLALSGIDGDPTIISASLLAQAGSEKDLGSFLASLRTVAHFSGRGAQALAEQLREMRDAEPDPQRRAAIALILGTLSLDDASAALQLAIDKGNPETRARAASVLYGRGETEKALRVLRQLLDAPDWASRKPAFQTLREIKGVERQAVCPKLIEMLNHPEAETRSEAAATLGQIGPDEEGARALSRALIDKAPEVRRSAALAIGWHTSLPIDAAPELSQALADADPEVRTVAAYALVGIRTVAAYSLVGIKSADAALVQALLRTLREEEKSEEYGFHPLTVRASAIYALGNIGADAKTAIPDLAKELKSPQIMIRTNAARALAKIDPKPDLLVPILVDLLKDRDVWVLGAATEALGRIGPPAKDAVPALRETLKDGRPEVWKPAKQALEKIEGKSTVPGSSTSGIAKTETSRETSLRKDR